jgi:uncharacterized surface protein with fasciclin (FAS1) repeats
MQRESKGTATKVALKSIVETAVEAGSFKTLQKALRAAGLVETLQGEGPFTVFAPTDKAFSSLPKGALDQLLKDPEQLKSVLLYHVCRGKTPASAVIRMESVKPLGGGELRIRKSGKDVMINESRVTKADIACSNGVIHVIDKVLMPREK